MLNYNTLTIDKYSKELAKFIRTTEGLSPNVERLGDQKSTIGYGYTFERNNNVELWKASGIELSSLDWNLLERIDNATGTRKTNIAINFGKTLTKEEGESLLEHSYQEYERAANQLNMPES